MAVKGAKADSPRLSKAEQKIIESSVNDIRRVFRARNHDLTSLIGLVTKEEVADTKRAIEVRFTEDSVLNVVMVMVAFD